MIKILGVKIA